MNCHCSKFLIKKKGAAGLSFSASQRPDVVGVSLVVVVHVAVVEVHVPRVVRVGSKRRRRPIVVRLYARERSYYPSTFSTLYQTTVWSPDRTTDYRAFRYDNLYNNAQRAGRTHNDTGTPKSTLTHFQFWLSPAFPNRYRSFLPFTTRKTEHFELFFESFFDWRAADFDFPPHFGATSPHFVWQD